MHLSDGTLWLGGITRVRYVKIGGAVDHVEGVPSLDSCGSYSYWPCWRSLDAASAAFGVQGLQLIARPCGDVFDVEAGAV